MQVMCKPKILPLKSVSLIQAEEADKRTALAGAGVG